jgi:hypothetical protein
MRNAYKVWSESLNGGDNLEDFDVDERILLKMDLGEIEWEDVD